MDTSDRDPRPVSLAEPVADQREMLLARQVMAAADFEPQTVCLVILTGLAVLYTLYFAAGIVLPFVLALMLSLMLTPIAHFLVEKLRLPRMLASLLLILALFSAIGGVGYTISVPAAGWVAKAPQSLPVLQQKLSFLRRPIAMFSGGMRAFEGLMRDNGQPSARDSQPQGQANQPAGQQDQPKAQPSQPATQPDPVASKPSQPAPSAPMPSASGVGQILFDGTRSFLGQSFT